MKNLLNLGKALNKAEQKEVIGGRYLLCCEWCDDGTCNDWVPRGVACPFAAAC